MCNSFYPLCEVEYDRNRSHEIHTGGNFMILACQGRDKTPTIKEKKCPVCGHMIEVFSIDTEVVCEHCGQKVYNDALSCVQWCKYAKMCVGEETYNELKKVAEAQKARREAEKAEREARKASA